jgi:aspartate oxidase
MRSARKAIRTTIKRLEHLERSRPAAISRANPSDVRDRILASLNDRDESKGGFIRADFPFEEAGTNQLGLRERILKRLSDEDSLSVGEATR